MGDYSAFNMFVGKCNVFLGNYSGYSSGNYASNLPSYYNVFLGSSSGYYNKGAQYDIAIGYNADAYSGTASNPGEVDNSVAIGWGALVQNNNQFILGNNMQFVGIGMSADATGPAANLEIMTDANPVPPSVVGFIGSGYFNTTNFYSGGSGPGGTGFSGLKFRDLNSYSTPADPTSPNFSAAGNPFPTGVLSVDGFGNVIYIPASVSAFGSCSTPNVLSAGIGGAIDLNGGNFNFVGNYAGSTVDNVGIGWTSCSLPAKLSILQSSGGTNTMGEFVTNADASSGTNSSPVPLIGLESDIPANYSSYYNVAGWFQADRSTSAVSPEEYAIFVPETATPDLGTISGGTVDIGFQFSLDIPDYLLDVNDYARIDGTLVPSDSSLKKNIAPFKYGLKAIRNLNPISYKYNGIGGFDSTHNFIGLIAQNLQRNVPGGVKQSHIIKDTINRDTATILNIYEEAVMYTAVNAIKQLDSTVTEKSTKIDSLTQTVDSLRNAFKNIQNCLNQLCGNGHSRIRNNNGGGNNGDSNATITNVENVTLSDVNAYLLYQNIPNPFSTSTKINYYLPEGTQGAYIVFYDNYGNQMKQVQLSQTGNGTLNINPDNLSNGIYSYSLVVNGKVIDTKRMLLQK